MIFSDRKPTKPNRMLITPESGSDPFYATVVRADEPTEIGTPLNAHTFNGMLAGLAPAVESVDHPGCYYRVVNGATEWVNPPLLPGVAYKTTERFNGEVVFTALVDCGEMPNNSQKAIEHNIGMNKVIRFCGYAGTTALPLNMNDWATGSQRLITIDVSVSTTAVYIKSNYDASANSGMVQVWFTRG